MSDEVSPLTKPAEGTIVLAEDTSRVYCYLNDKWEDVALLVRPTRADWDAMTSDWQAVGEDLRSAMNRFDADLAAIKETNS